MRTETGPRPSTLICGATIAVLLIAIVFHALSFLLAAV